MPPYLKTLRLCAFLALTLLTLESCKRDPLIRKQKHNTLSAVIDGTFQEADSIAVFEEAVTVGLGALHVYIYIDAYFNDPKISHLEFRLTPENQQDYSGIHPVDKLARFWGYPRDASIATYNTCSGNFFVAEHDNDRDASIQKITGTFDFIMANDEPDTIQIEEGNFELVLGN